MSMSAPGFEETAARLRASLARFGPGAASSDHDLNAGQAEMRAPATSRAAAVLIALLDRPTGPALLFTERARHLKRHAGQVAFPGGTLDPDDASPEAAALREAWEEVALDPAAVEVIGRLGPYHTVTGFAVTPVVALARPAAPFVPEPAEVADIFEAPFAHLMDPANHEIREGVWKGKTRRYYAISYRDRFIWGATAGMLMALHRTVFAKEAAA